MGKLLLIYRLAARDMRRRPAEAVLLLLAIAATTTTLTLGLALGGTANHPWDNTRAATAGPDIAAEAFNGSSAADLAPLAHAPGVSGASGPYPQLLFHDVRIRGIQVAAVLQGRDAAPAAVDRPDVTAGTWVRDGGVVVEQGFADALGLHVGDSITVAGRPLTVTGVAVTTARSAYPLLTPGLMWVTRADAARLIPAAKRLAPTTAPQTPEDYPVTYAMNLKLTDPASAQSFVFSHHGHGIRVFMRTWQDLKSRATAQTQAVQAALLIGSWLLALLAIASVAVLVGGRMADQTRRVGLLKAVGATPKLVAAVLMAEHLALALAAAAVGLITGRLTAPLLTHPSSSLLGTSGALPLTASTVAMVAGAAVIVAGAATLVPAIRGARTTTLGALNDAARLPRRRPRLIAMSARLPVPLLLGLRLAARRPRRTLLAAVSLMITVAMVVAALAIRYDVDIQNAERTAGIGYLAGNASPVADRVGQVFLTLTVILVVLAAINAVFITQATVRDSRHPSALARALGATPRQTSGGLSAAQLFPALVAAIIGFPAGIGLYGLARTAGGAHGTQEVLPPLWSLMAVLPITLIVVAALTAVPARIAARHPVADALRSE